MHPKDADRMTNSVDPDQEQSVLGLHFLLRPVCLKTQEHYGNIGRHYWVLKTRIMLTLSRCMTVSPRESWANGESQ